MAARRPSVLSRFRLAGLIVLLGVAVVGGVSYTLVNSHYIGLVISKTLGPYTDSLAQYALDNRDPELWRQIAMRHGVAMRIESPGGEAVGFDSPPQEFAGTKDSVLPHNLVERPGSHSRGQRLCARVGLALSAVKQIVLAHKKIPHLCRQGSNL